MSDAPERIWAGECHFRWWQTEPFGNLDEYIRADLHKAAIAQARREALQHGPVEDKEMLALARRAVAHGQSRSSFEQMAGAMWEDAMYGGDED